MMSSPNIFVKQFLWNLPILPVHRFQPAEHVRQSMAGTPSARGGSSFGKPFIHLGPVGLSGSIADFRELFQAYGKRFATFCAKK